MDWIVVGSEIKIPVEIALTPQEQEVGLMFRLSPANMAFVYKKAETRAFWMKNTYIPLDIVFCREGRISSIQQGDPQNQTHIIGLADLVIEMPRGSVEKYGIEIGKEVQLQLSLNSLVRRWEV